MVYNGAESALPSGFSYSANTLTISSTDTMLSYENGYSFILRAAEGQEKTYLIYLCGIDMPNPIWSYNPL